MRTTRARRAALAALLTGALAIPAVPVTAGESISQDGVVLSGLRNPRGLTFDGTTLYVAESGTGGPGPCIDGPEGTVAYGDTGAIYQAPTATGLVDQTATDANRVVDHLPSLASMDDPETTDVDESGFAATGPADVHVAGDTITFTIGLGADPAIRDQAPAAEDCSGGIDGAGAEDDFATVQQFDTLAATLTELADLGEYESTNNPDGDVIDTNPFGIARHPEGGFEVLDSGANAQLHVADDRTVSTTEAFEPVTMDAPDFLPLPRGARIPTHAVPTGIVPAPGGGFTRGFLTGFPFQPGAAWVDTAGQDPALAARYEGFTNVMDVAWGPDGNLYVLEIAHDGLLSGPIGALLRVDPDEPNTRHVLRDGLFAPGGITFGPDSRAYISVCSICPDTGPQTGTVLRYDAVAAPPLVTVTDDSATVEEDATATVEVLDNDSSGDTGGLALEILDVVHGSATEGSIVYQPPANFTGTDTVTYRACDEENHCAIGRLAVTVTESVTDRLAGTGRIETAVVASRAAFPHGADVVVIARADAYPDALTAGVLAGVLNAPILLTPTDALAASTAAEIDRLGATEAVVIGGESAVSKATYDAIDARPGIATIERVSGGERFATAAAVKAEIEQRTGTAATHVYVAEGFDPDPTRGWPDALAIAYLAAHEQRPILLVTTDELPEPTANELAGLDATIIGGLAAVSLEVEAAIGDIADQVDRIEGDTRFETSVEIAKVAATRGLDNTLVFLASGGNWPDAIVAGPVVAELGGVLLLVAPNDLDNSGPARSYLEAGGPYTDVDLFGGTAAISQQVEDQVAAAVQ